MTPPTRLQQIRGTLVRILDGIAPGQEADMLEFVHRIEELIDAKRDERATAEAAGTAGGAGEDVPPEDFVGFILLLGNKIAPNDRAEFVDTLSQLWQQNSTLVQGSPTAPSRGRLRPAGAKARSPGNATTPRRAPDPGSATRTLDQRAFHRMAREVGPLPTSMLAVETQPAPPTDGVSDEEGAILMYDACRVGGSYDAIRWDDLGPTLRAMFVLAFRFAHDIGAAKSDRAHELRDGMIEMHRQEAESRADKAEALTRSNAAELGRLVDAAESRAAAAEAKAERLGAFNIRLQETHSCARCGRRDAPLDDVCIQCAAILALQRDRDAVRAALCTLADVETDTGETTLEIVGLVEVDKRHVAERASQAETEVAELRGRVAAIHRATGNGKETLDGLLRRGVSGSDFVTNAMSVLDGVLERTMAAVGALPAAERPQGDRT